MHFLCEKEAHQFVVCNSCYRHLINHLYLQSVGVFRMECMSRLVRSDSNPIQKIKSTYCLSINEIYELLLSI